MEYNANQNNLNSAPNSNDQRRLNAYAMQAGGKTLNAAGTGVKVAGKTVSATGKGIDNAGKGIDKLGTSLNSSGYGAIAGVPLNILGKGVSALGKGVDLGGKGVSKTGDTVKNAGKTLDNKGKNIAATADAVAAATAANITLDNKRKQKIKIKKTKGNKETRLILYSVCIIFGLIILLFMFLVMSITASNDKSEESNNNKLSANDYNSLSSNINGSNNQNLWIPIGSKEVSTNINVNGENIEFRSGTPTEYRISSYYGSRANSFHYGIDITGAGDIYLVALADGEITYISDTRYTGYNNKPDTNFKCSSHAGLIKIHIKHNNGLESRYLHIKEASIPEYLKVGSRVYQGQVIAMMGNTGCSTGQHLHLELLLNGQKVNPLDYLSIENPRPIETGINNRSEDIILNLVGNKNNVIDNFINGKDNKQTVCLNFRNLYSDNVVAGLMVNIEKESSFDPTNVTLDSNNEYSGGLFQWNASRLTALKSRHGENWTSIANQIEYFLYEIANTEKSTQTILNDNSLSAVDVSYKFCKTFERAKNCEPRKNETLVNKYVTYVTNGCN